MLNDPLEAKFRVFLVLWDFYKPLSLQAVLYSMQIWYVQGGGGGRTTLKFFPLDTNNQNQTLHDVGYAFEEFIC